MNATGTSQGTPMSGQTTKVADRLSDLLDQAADRAIADGIGAAELQESGAPGCKLDQWIRRNVKMRAGTEFFVNFLLACEIAKKLNLNGNGSNYGQYEPNAVR